MAIPTSTKINVYGAVSAVATNAGGAVNNINLGAQLASAVAAEVSSDTPGNPVTASFAIMAGGTAFSTQAVALASDLKNNANASIITADIFSLIGDSATVIGAIAQATETKLGTSIGTACEKTGEAATILGATISNRDALQNYAANSPALSAVIKQVDTELDQVSSYESSLTTVFSNTSSALSNAWNSTEKYLSTAVNTALTALSNFGNSAFDADASAISASSGGFQDSLSGLVASSNIKTHDLTENATNNTETVNSGDATLPTDTISLNPGVNGSPLSIVAKSQSPNSLVETTTYTADSAGALTSIDIEDATASIVGQADAIYSYKGNEIFQNGSGTPEGLVTATAEFNLPSAEYTGGAQPILFSLHWLGQTLQNKVYGLPNNFTFSDGNITQWGLEIATTSLTIYTQNNAPAGRSALDAVSTQFYGGPNTVQAYNANNPGIWTEIGVGSAITVSPHAGQTQQLSSVLTNTQLASQGPLRALTINGPGTVAVTGVVAVPDSGISSGDMGTFTDNGTISLGVLGTNVLNLANMNLIGSGVIQQQGENDATYVSSVTDTNFQITSGSLHLANPTGFGGTIGPTVASAASMGIFGEVDIANAQSVASGSFDTSTGMLSLLNSTGANIGNIHFGGDARGLRLTAEPARGSSAAYLAINDQGTSANGAGGNIPLTFHA
jgi:hypothetical protein